jgi:hypothetical protein
MFDEIGLAFVTSRKMAFCSRAEALRRLSLVLFIILFYPPARELFQFDGILRALENAGAAGDAAFLVVEDDHPLFVIRRPASDRADVITLPNAFAFLRVKMDLQAP